MGAVSFELREKITLVIYCISLVIVYISQVDNVRALNVLMYFLSHVVTL